MRFKRYSALSTASVLSEVLINGGYYYFQSQVILNEIIYVKKYFINGNNLALCPWNTFSCLCEDTFHSFTLKLLDWPCFKSQQGLGLWSRPGRSVLSRS